MQIPIQTSDLEFINAITTEYKTIVNEISESDLSEDDLKSHVAVLIGYTDYADLVHNALEYIEPYQVSILKLMPLFMEKMASLFPSDMITAEIVGDVIKTGFLKLKAVNSLCWKFEEREIEGKPLYKVALADTGKEILLETGTFVIADDVPNKDTLSLECSDIAVADFLNIKKTLGYSKQHLTLSMGIDNMLAEILASITFEASVIPLNDENFDFKEQTVNTMLLSLPALVRICGDELDLYGYVFDANEDDSAYYCVVLNEFYSNDLEIYFGDIIEVKSDHMELLPNPALYRDLLAYHNSVEPEYTPEDLKECLAQYCPAEDMKLFDLWYKKFMVYLNEIDQNFYATKIMNHITNLVLNEKFLKHKVLHLIRYSEEQYKQYKRNEISLNRESYKIRRLINLFMQGFLASKGVEIDFVQFDEKDYLEFIKKEKVLNNDQSKLAWLSSKYIGEEEFQKKLYDLGSFAQQSDTPADQ